MIKVKTFTTGIKIFHTKEELDKLDETVNKFLMENRISSVISVSDSCTTNDSGATIGLIRCVTYKEG